MYIKNIDCISNCCTHADNKMAKDINKILKLQELSWIDSLEIFRDFFFFFDSLKLKLKYDDT